VVLIAIILHVQGMGWLILFVSVWMLSYLKYAFNSRLSILWICLLIVLLLTDFQFLHLAANLFITSLLMSIIWYHLGFGILIMIHLFFILLTEVVVWISKSTILMIICIIVAQVLHHIKLVGLLVIHY